MDRIVVCGTGSKVGKTTMITAMLNNISGRKGVIKTSIHQEIEQKVTTEQTFIRRRGTDTAAFLNNEADRVVFLQSDYQELKNSLDQALQLMGEVDYLLLEGNSLLDFINPELVVYLKVPGIKASPSAQRAEAKADLVIAADILLADLRIIKDEKQGKEQGNVKSWGQRLDFNQYFSGGKYSEQEQTLFRFQADRMPCYKAHLLAAVLGLDLLQLGNYLDRQGIRINSCQLGLF